MTMIIALLWKRFKERFIFLLPLIFFAVLGFALGFYHSRDHWEAPLKDTIQKYEDSERKLKTELSLISFQASADAAIANMIIIEKQNAIDEVVKSYDILKKSSKVKIIKVSDDTGNTLDIKLDEFGNQICSKFDSAYLTSLNSMIEKANK